MSEWDASPVQPLPPRERCERVGCALRIAAPAKLNLDLHVGPLGDDGYHPLDSIVAKVTLYDDILLRLRTDGEITLCVDGANCGPDERNLALRAARLLAEETHLPWGVDIHLTKAIPPGRGLGGGSSDAAAVLDGLDRLWRLELTDEEFSELAAELGSDVPLFLGPAASRMTGRGERLRGVAVHSFVAVLFVPDLSLSTAEVYGQFDRLAGDTPPLGERDVRTMDRRPPSRWPRPLRNDLLPAALAASEPFRQTFEQLRERLGDRLAMTGSGSAMFVLCDDEEQARGVLGLAGADWQGQTVLVADNLW